MSERTLVCPVFACVFALVCDFVCVCTLCMLMYMFLYVFVHVCASICMCVYANTSVCVCACLCMFDMCIHILLFAVISSYVFYLSISLFISIQSTCRGNVQAIASHASPWDCP